MSNKKEAGFIVHIASHHTTGKRYSSVKIAQNAMNKALRWDKVTPKYPAADYVVMGLEEYVAKDVEVETYNILNPKAGPIMIKRSQKGGCCDPGTERYHCM